MSWTALAILLMVSGAVAEVGGISLVVADIRATRRRVEDVKARDYEMPEILTPVGSSLTLQYEVKGRQPTFEERLERVEHRVEDVDQRVMMKDLELEEKLSRALRNAVGVVDRHAHERDAAMRAFVRKMLLADLGRRALGVVLLLIGIALATAGNLVSLKA